MQTKHVANIVNCEIKMWQVFLRALVTNQDPKSL